MDVLKVDGGALYQWDTGRRVVIKPAEGCTVSEAHFANPDGDDALIVELKTENERIYAPIPNILLHGSGHIHVFATIVTADGRRTICDKIFNIRPRQKPSDYVYTETEVYSIKTALEKALREAKESGEFNGADGKDGLSEWDHVITSADLTSIDPTTNEKVFDITKLDKMLTTMSGRVLVKGVKYYGTDSDGSANFGRVNINVPRTVTLIKFIESNLYASIVGFSSTTISGFVGNLSNYQPYEHEHFCEIYGFGAVEFCQGGGLYVSNCSNVKHCTIREAYKCVNLTDIDSHVDYSSGSDHVSFSQCDVIDNVRIDGREDYMSGVEFYRCTNINNVYNINETVPIDYIECKRVDGDTCDGYYTAEDNGKVQTVSTDGTKSLISVYDKDEIDTKLGDISTILTALHVGGIE